MKRYQMRFRSWILHPISCRLHYNEDTGRRANCYRSQKNPPHHLSISHHRRLRTARATHHLHPRARSLPERKRKCFMPAQGVAACAKFPSSVDSTANFSPPLPAEPPSLPHAPRFRRSVIFRLRTSVFSCVRAKVGSDAATPARRKSRRSIRRRVQNAMRPTMTSRVRLRMVQSAPRSAGSQANACPSALIGMVSTQRKVAPAAGNSSA
jgi:hypothetical protein